MLSDFLWPILAAFFIFPLVFGSCPPGFELVQNGECRGNYTRISTFSDEGKDAAVQLCNEIHGLPIIIHNEEQQKYWAEQAGKTMEELIVIGLTCNWNSKKWEWVDGSAVNYKALLHGAPLDNADCTSWYFGFTWLLEYNGAWTFYSSSHQPLNSDIWCSVPHQQPPINPEGCLGFQDDTQDGVCYSVGDKAENWQDAQLNCKKVGANLASIHNINENNFIRRLAVSAGAVEGVFIGATVSGKEGNFGWVDGTSWDYENYSPGYPRPGFGDCLVMDTSTSAGQWINSECAQQLPAACIRDQRHANERNFTCSSDTHFEGEVVTSPGFPFDASMPCDFFLEVDEGKKVEVEIFLEANSCCDFLVVHDGYFGDAILANLTGSIRNVTYTTTSSNIMKVSWQPNGGVNVKGAAMTFRGV